MKKLMILLAAILLAAIAYYFLPGKIEGIALEEIEEQGERVFGTDVEVSDLLIDIANGTASIREISIANPQGYSQPFAMTLSSITAKFDYKSQVIDQIIVAEPHVYAEFKGKDLNILDLANQAERARKGAGGGKAAQAEVTDNQAIDEPSEQEDDEAIIMTINLVALDKATVDIRSDLTDQQKQFTIDRLEARDLHGNKQQLTNQLVKGLFNDLAKQVISESTQSLEEQALKKLKDKAKEKLKKLFE